MLANFKHKFFEDLKNLRANTGDNMNKSEQYQEEWKMQKALRLKELKETISEHNSEALFADGYDNSIMGYSSDMRVIYSADQIVQTLVERDGMTPDEAIEFFNFNFSYFFVNLSSKPFPRSFYSFVSSTN